MSSILALDLGEKRIGVARAGFVARLPEPLTTLNHDDQLIEHLRALVDEQEASLLVVGFPRGMKGQTTQQTQTIENLAQKLQQQLNIPVVFQDETLTSVQAEAELHNRGVRYNKAAIDALAACLILDDYLRTHPQPTE